MKRKDITLVVVVAVFSLVIALVASKLIFGQSTERNQSAEVVEPISATFAQPDTKYFNDKSVDPTEVITIGDNDNQAPFNQPSSQ